MRRLASLPNLESLWLRGNPLSEAGDKVYRRGVFGVFTEFGDRGGTVDFPTLDGVRVKLLAPKWLLLVFLDEKYWGGG